MKSSNEIKDIIEKEFKDLPDSFIAVIITSTRDYLGVNAAIVNYMVNQKKMQGTYITMNKPYETLVNSLKQSNIDIDQIFFIDAISNFAGNKKIKAKNCLVLQNPSALTELEIAISKKYNSKNMRFMLIDSLSTMLIYNNKNTIVKFIHCFITQLRKYKLSGIIMALEKDIEQKTLDSITQFCDKSIKI